MNEKPILKLYTFQKFAAFFLMRSDFFSAIFNSAVLISESICNFWITEISSKMKILLSDL